MVVVMVLDLQKIAGGKNLMFGVDKPWSHDNKMSNNY